MSGLQLKQIALFVIISISILVNSLPLSDGISNTGVGGVHFDNQLIDTNSHHRRNLIGDQLEAIGVASQNLSVNSGNSGETNHHSAGNGNAAQQAAADVQETEVVSNITALIDSLLRSRRVGVEVAVSV